MKTHSRLLRGYNNNLSANSEELSAASVRAIENKQNKCRESTFSTPSYIHFLLCTGLKRGNCLKL